VAVNCIGRGNRSTRRKPPTCRKSLSKLYYIMLYRVHLWAKFEHTTLVVIGTDCIGSYKSNYHKITTTTGPDCIYSICDISNTLQLNLSLVLQILLLSIIVSWIVNDKTERTVKYDRERLIIETKNRTTSTIMFMIGKTSFVIVACLVFNSKIKRNIILFILSSNTFYLNDISIYFSIVCVMYLIVAMEKGIRFRYI
jgi:hypothetical protein